MHSVSKPHQIETISKITDLGRLFAAIAIFYFHVGLYTGFFLSEWGEYAVSFFIILSGIAYSCFSSVKPASWPTYRRYMGGRFMAIFPIVVLVNCAIFAASYIYPSSLGRPFSVPELLLSASGLSQYFGYRYLSSVMWFIPFILQAYLLFPLIDACLNRVSSLLITVAAFVLSLLCIGLAFYCWPTHATEICRNWSPLFRLPEVSLGLVIGRSINSRHELRRGLVSILLFAVLAFLLSKLTTSESDYIFSLPWRGLIVIAGIFAAAIIAAAGSGSARNASFLRLLGTASFPFFLAHGIAILFIKSRFGSALFPWAAYFVLCWCGALAFTLAFRRVNYAIQLHSRAASEA